MMKVLDFEFTIFAENNARSSDIAMDNSLRVNISESFSKVL